MPIPLNFALGRSHTRIHGLVRAIGLMKTTENNSRAGVCTITCLLLGEVAQEPARQLVRGPVIMTAMIRWNKRWHVNTGLHQRMDRFRHCRHQYSRLPLCYVLGGDAADGLAILALISIDRMSGATGEIM